VGEDAVTSSEPRLTREQIEALRRRLQDERDRLAGMLGAPAATVPSDDEQTEFEETAQRSTELTDRLAIADREQRLIAEVNRALEKLEAGTYGVSETTGAPIPYRRLSAIPWAREDVDDA
jgi:DnaK suppressor protein